MRKFLISFLFISLSFLNSIYASETDLQISSTPSPSAEAISNNELLSLKGIVKSSAKHREGALCKVTLEFTDDKTGKSFELEDANSLEALHCEKEKDLVVNITAKKEARFLFWGGDLKLSSFEVLGEQESAPHIRANSVSYNRRSERFFKP